MSFKKLITVIADNAKNLIGRYNDDSYFFWGVTNRVDFTEYQKKEGEPNEENLIRVFRVTDSGCHIQYRAYTSLGGKQKERNLAACAYFSKEDIVHILNRIDKHAIFNSNDGDASAWDFVEKYYPNYYSCNDIARADDLTKILDGEHREGDCASDLLKDEFEGDMEKVKHAYNELHASIYKKAIAGYILTLGSFQTDKK